MKRRPKGVRAPGQGRAPAPRPEATLQYKVVELSTVDEGQIEAALNDWTAKGWSLEGLQFAMRESSKRPAMAFVFFTRLAAEPEHDPAEAQDRLRRLAGGFPEPRLRPVSAQERLEQLAEEDEPEGEP